MRFKLMSPVLILFSPIVKEGQTWSPSLTKKPAPHRPGLLNKPKNARIKAGHKLGTILNYPGVCFQFTRWSWPRPSSNSTGNSGRVEIFCKQIFWENPSHIKIFKLANLAPQGSSHDKATFFRINYKNGVNTFTAYLRDFFGNKSRDKIKILIQTEKWVNYSEPKDLNLNGSIQRRP